ncbi:hypothetical protein [Kitasatospora sp. NPDC059827]|uniref:hypothetical protein n=1 Tax=Kitasatospora sp. NPDC059827 TaxID=3346964 RepID=UPI00364ADD4A
MTTEPEQPPAAAADPSASAASAALVEPPTPPLPPVPPVPPAPPVPPVPPAPPVPPVPAPSPWSAEGEAMAHRTAHQAPAAPEPDPAAQESAAPAVDVYADFLSAGPETAPRPSRRPRPVLLSVCALVVGVLAGGSVGYAIQAQRPPTPLPPLQVALPAYPAETVDPAALAAAQPPPPAIEGDLRKLLVSAPDGSTAWGDYPDKPGWMSIGELAERKGDAAVVFKDLATSGFRRAAEVDWMKGDTRYRVTLTQYTPEHIDEAAAFHGQTFADDTDGGYRVDPEPRQWSDTKEQYYYGHAAAQRGTVLMTVEVFSPKPVESGDLKALAKQQWERLT